MEKSLLYIDLINENEGEYASEIKSLKNDKAKIQAKNILNTTRASLIEAKQELMEARKADPYCFERVFKAKTEVISLEEGLRIALELFKESF